LRLRQGADLSRLPGTRDEVQSIARLFPASRCHVYLGRKSTQHVLAAESLKSYRRIHFATHCVIDDRSPYRSAIMLAPGPDDDGALDVRAISALDLDCDLVVLSACQTGGGRLTSGEGILGLSRAFLSAGALSVVASLWNVTDISTAHLMKDFYQHM